MAEITIKDIARICGVGVSTVSRAINNHPDINPGTRKQIQEVIDQYGYIPNNSARNLKRTESNAVAILIKGITNPLFNSMIKVFDEKLKRNRLTMILQHVNYEEDEIAIALELIKEKRLYDFSTAKIVRPKNGKYVTIEIESYLESTPDDRLTVKLGPKLQDGEWMLDSATY